MTDELFPGGRITGPQGGKGPDLFLWTQRAGKTARFQMERKHEEFGREKLQQGQQHIAKKYYALPSEQDDLISIGTIGLMKAVDTFDSTRRARFSTYASRCIENAILSQRNKRRLRWRNGCLLRQNGACRREWESAARF